MSDTTLFGNPVSGSAQSMTSPPVNPYLLALMQHFSSSGVGGGGANMASALGGAPSAAAGMQTGTAPIIPNLPRLSGMQGFAAPAMTPQQQQQGGGSDFQSLLKMLQGLGGGSIAGGFGATNIMGADGLAEIGPAGFAVGPV